MPENKRTRINKINSVKLCVREISQRLRNYLKNNLLRSRTKKKSQNIIMLENTI